MQIFARTAIPEIDHLGASTPLTSKDSGKIRSEPAGAGSGCQVPWVLRSANLGNFS